MSKHLRVNPIACEAHGMCAELLPELISLDEWGYPIVDHKPVPAEIVANAERAAAACPTFALLVERRREQPAAPRREQPAAPRREQPAAPRRERAGAGAGAGSGVRNVRRRVPRVPGEPRV